MLSLNGVVWFVCAEAYGSANFGVTVTVNMPMTVDCEFRYMIIIINVNTVISPSVLSRLLFLCCRPYVLPDHYTIPVVPGDYNAIDKPRGMLFVTIISAKNVPKMDWFNGSDPYVRYTTKLNGQSINQLPLPVFRTHHRDLSHLRN